MCTVLQSGQRDSNPRHSVSGRRAADRHPHHSGHRRSHGDLQFDERALSDEQCHVAEIRADDVAEREIATALVRRHDQPPADKQRIRPLTT